MLAATLTGTLPCFFDVLLVLGVGTLFATERIFSLSELHAPHVSRGTNYLEINVGMLFVGVNRRTTSLNPQRFLAQPLTGIFLLAFFF